MQTLSHTSLRILMAAAFVAVSALAGERQIAFDPYKHVIWIPVSVDDGPPLTFAFDSAAARSAIDWDRAEEQKISFTPLGARFNAGSGDGTARLGRTGAIRIHMPGAVLDLPAIGVVPLRGVSESYGHRMDGIVGAELLARYVVEVDWEHHRMALHDPAAFRYSGNGVSVPLVVAGGMPFVRVHVVVPGAKAVEGLFLVDCPHPGTIIINRPFADQNALLDAAWQNLPRLVVQHAKGVNGKSEVLHGRIAELGIGPFVLREPVVGFSQAKAGALASTQFAGILGAEVLRRFRVIFDFSRDSLILEPKTALAQPFRYDASGIRVRATGVDLREYAVAGVIEDSPASRARLQEGDRLIEIGGKQVKGMVLGEILDILKRDGETLPIRIQRGSHRLDLTLELRRLI